MLSGIYMSLATAKQMGNTFNKLASAGFVFLPLC